MPRREHQQAPQPPPGRALLLSPERASKLLALLDRLDLEPDPTQFDKYTRAGQVFFRLRASEQTAAAGGGGASSPFYARISAVPDSDPVTWQASVTLGYLEYQNAGSAEFDPAFRGYVVPTINGVSMEDSEELEPLALPGLVSFIYLRVKTDADGVLKPAEGLGGGYQVTVEAFEEEQTTVHHVRPSPSGGEEEGDYFILLCETESDGGSPAAPRVVRRITGNREMVNQLIEISNIGGERELYKGYLPGPDDKHEIRSLEQLQGGEDQEVNVIQDLESGEEEGDTLPFKGLGVKQEGEYPPRPANFEEGPDRKANLLKFTGIDGDVSVPSSGGTFNFAGGLAVSFNGNGEEENEGDDFNLEFYTWGVTSDGSSEVFTTKLSLVHTIYFRNGLALLDDDMAVVPIKEAVADLVGGF